MKRSAKTPSACCFLVLGFLMLFGMSNGEAQNSSTQCKQVWKYVWVNEYNPATKQIEYQYVYRYVYDCPPTLTGTDSTTMTVGRSTDPSEQSASRKPTIEELTKIWNQIFECPPPPNKRASASSQMQFVIGRRPLACSKDLFPRYDNFIEWLTENEYRDSRYNKTRFLHYKDFEGLHWALGDGVGHPLKIAGVQTVWVFPIGIKFGKAQVEVLVPLNTNDLDDINYALKGLDEKPINARYSIKAFADLLWPRFEGDKKRFMEYFLSFDEK